jgi:hypothetical protein
MNLPFLNKSLVQFVTVIFLAVILLWAIWSGFSSGRENAQSELLVHNARQLVGALDYFYQNQDRFPTAGEFIDANLMGQYVKPLPIQQIVGNTCAQSFDYKRLSPDSFQLLVCLPRAGDGFQRGWNQLMVNKK